MVNVDYQGAIIVIEASVDDIVLVHPNDDAYASLPGDPCHHAETPEDGAVRIAREMTGLEIRLLREIVTFVQEGTPTGTMLAHGYVATPIGGTILERGSAGAVAAYPIDALPEIVPVRVAIQRVLTTYLADRGRPGSHVSH